MKKRKVYDTRVKYLVRRDMLPDAYSKKIHRSLIWKWKQESNEKYIGYELNLDVEQLYELMKKFSQDEKMQKTVKTIYRINKTLRDVIGIGKEYIKKIKAHKYKIVDAITRGKQTIGIKRGIKLFGISRSTFHSWSMEAFYRCGVSLTKLCNNAYPQQLTINEIYKMHRMLSNAKFLHWPIISVAYYGMKRSLLKAHPNTWYKYARLMQIVRNRYKKIHRVYEEGLRANAPNEKWHADITELRTADGKTSYIYLVVDNFSRYITSWRVSNKICAKTRLETFEETILLAGLKPKKKKEKNTTELIVDGGTENNNAVVQRFIDRFPVEKVVALKDIIKSNAMIESVNKIIKYDYLFPKNLQNQTHLVNFIRNFVIPDYNDKRPHGSLNGLTPLEAYGGRSVNFLKIRQQMLAAYQQRIKFNQTHSCLGCPFGCKN